MLREARHLARKGRLAEAADVYRRVLFTDPGRADAWYNLARVQRMLRRFDEALASYQTALDLGIKRPEEVHLNRGVIYADDLGRPDAAEAELDAALAANPAYVPALLNLANLHEDRGRREPALDIYRRILAQDPAQFAALARLAEATAPRDIDGALIERLQRAIEDPKTDAADRAALRFALGRALDAAGEYDRAFEAYAAANRDSRASAGAGFAAHDAAAEAALIDRLIAVVPPERAARVPPRAAAVQDPIFICGMFRSGSTLVERLLAAHPRVAAGGELDILPSLVRNDLAPFPEGWRDAPNEKLDAIAVRYLAALRRLAPGARFVTDKRPDNFWYIGVIKSLFPEAKIVHTVRDPLDNCLSIFFLHLDQRMAYALDLTDIGRHYRQYLRLMAHWKALYGGDIIDVDYDALVASPAAEGRRLYDFLGLDWDEEFLSDTDPIPMVKTASVWQVREPIHARSSGRARRYARHLEALESALAADFDLR